MAVTVNKYGNNANRLTAELYGLSTDEKPVEEIEGVAIENGSVFIEIDTGNSYFYDKENKEWLEQ
jgi:hypothetical protein